MTLKEKLCEPFGGLKTETVNELEQIADDFAIDFAEWFFDKNWNKNILSTFEFKKQLEIYKKEII